MHHKRFLLGLLGTLPLGCVVGTYEPDWAKETVSVGGNGSGGAASTVMGATNTGGKSGVIGSATTGGSTLTTVGGSANAGGNANTVEGGATAGGASDAGGTSATGGHDAGGSSSAGGALNVGGTTTTGGAANLGGDTAAGGTQSTPGGASGTGGALVTLGGVPGIGGALAVGGTVALTTDGGSSAAGGVTATGGTVAAAGGAPPVTGGSPGTGGVATTGGLPSTGGTSGVPVPAAVQVTTGDSHSCVLLDNGTVWCWGANGSGQLGIDPAELAESNIPVRVPLDKLGLAKVKSVTAGGVHSCALLDNGHATCWGFNKYGQIGIGTKSEWSAPARVLSVASTPLTGVEAIDAGYSFTCALVNESNGGRVVKCWGYGEDGELGNGRAGADYSEPYPVTVITSIVTLNPLPGITQISAGYFHACATDGDRFTHCWGYNKSGQLGDGTTTNSNLPLPVKSSSGDKFLSDDVQASNNLTCAITREAVHCWGANGYGQLGAGSKDESSATPLAVQQKEKALKLSVGYSHACIVDTAGMVECWGDGQYGQLGLDIKNYPCNGNSYTCSNVPLVVDYPIQSTDNQIAVGGWFTSLLDSRSAIHSIGSNLAGNLGTGDSSFSYSEKPLEIYYSWRAGH